MSAHPREAAYPTAGKMDTRAACALIVTHATSKLMLLIALLRWTTVEALIRSTPLASARSLWSAWPTQKTSFTLSDVVRKRRTSKV